MKYDKHEGEAAKQAALRRSADGTSRLMQVLSLVLCAASMSNAAAQTIPADLLNYSRTTSYTYDPVTGRVATETLEPDADKAPICLSTTYGRDAYGNVSSKTEANCPGTIPARQQITARTNYQEYSPSSPVSVAINGVAVPLPQGAFPQIATNALSQQTKRRFDPRFGHVSREEDPNGVVTNWSFDSFGRRSKESRPDGTGTVYYYCILSAAGLDTTSNTASCPTPSSSEIPADAFKFVHAEPIDSTGVKTGPYVRSYFDRQDRSIRVATEGYDGAGQPSAVRGGSVVTDVDYDAYGSKIIETAAYFVQSASSSTVGSNDYGMTLSIYDVLGRTAEVRSSDANGSVGNTSFGSRGSRPTAVRKFAYDALTTKITDDKGRVQTIEKDILARDARITDRQDGQLVLQPDAFGNLIATKDALQNRTTLKFDYRGRRVELNDPDLGLLKSDFDPLGELVWEESPKLRANSSARTYAYDLIGRRVSRTEPEYVTTWSYDKYSNGQTGLGAFIGQLCEVVTDAGLRRRFRYDSIGRLIAAKTAITNGPSFAAATEYDSVTGRITSTTFPTGLKILRGYTARGYLEKLKLSQSATVTPLPPIVGGTAGPPTTLAAGSDLWMLQKADARGTGEALLLGNGVTSRVEADPLTRRPVSVQAGIGTSSAILSYSYSWDSEGNLKARTDANGDGSGASVGETYEYDGLDRLATYTVSSPTIPGLIRKVDLIHNALGNLLYKSDVGVYGYNSTTGSGDAYHGTHGVLNISGAVTATYLYDANGNVESSTSGKFRSIAYTSFNLPDSTNGLAGPNGSPRYLYSYDDGHGRIKEERRISSGVAAGVRTTWYLHPDQSGGLSFEHEINSPTVSSPENPAKESSRHYIDVGGSHVAVLVSNASLPVLGDVAMNPPTLNTANLSKIEYWHQDHLGSVASTTNHAGAVTARMSYDPFGKRRWPDGRYDTDGAIGIDWSPAIDHGNDRGYTSHEHLDDVGIIHMNGRLFEPTIGRFLQSDPVVHAPADLQSYDRFGYCNSNPSLCTDPSGFDWNTSVAGKDAADAADEQRKAEYMRMQGACVTAGGSLSECARMADRSAAMDRAGVTGGGPGGEGKRNGGNTASAEKGVEGPGLRIASWEEIRPQIDPTMDPMVRSAGVGLASLAAVMWGSVTGNEALVQAGFDGARDLRLSPGEGLSMAMSLGMGGRQPKAGVPGPEFVPSEAVTGPYVRPSGAGPTAAQRSSVQGKPCVDCGALTSRQVADHIEPLVVQHYRTGSVNVSQQRSLEAVQPHCPSCSAAQGGQLGIFSRLMKDWFGF